MKKLLLIGSNHVHTFNFYKLIESYFDQILLIVNNENNCCDILPHKTINSSIHPPTNICTAIKKISHTIYDFRPDIIHILQIDTSAVCTIIANRNSKIPTVVTALGSDILINPKKNIFLKKMVQYVLNRGDYFTSDSIFMGEEMKKLARKNIDVEIANFGIDISKRLKQKQNIIYSNRLHKPLYRIDSIIKAFKKFSESNPDWKLVIGATGEETENLVKLSKELDIYNKTEFVGWLDKETNYYYYSIAQYWVSIPESDATAISLLEAMSMDCIPIVSNLPANNEWINHKENGFIVNDVEEDFISEAVKFKFANCFSINTQLIEKKASKEASREKFVKIYKKITSSK